MSPVRICDPSLQCGVGEIFSTKGDGKLESRTITILQEYVPQYRVPFFAKLSHVMLAHNHRLQIAAGVPVKSFGLRNDTSAGAVDLFISARHFRLLGRRITVRRTRQIRQGSDVIVLEHARRNLDIYRLFVPKRLRARSIALWGHGKDFVKAPSLVDRLLMDALARRADWYFAYTESGARHLIGIGVDPSRVTVVQNTVDTESIRAAVSVEDRSQARKSLGIQDDYDHVVLFMGALDTGKGIDLLFDSIIDLRARVPGVALVIAGEGECRDRVIREVANNDWIYWVGNVDAQTKGRVLAASDIIAVPGRIGLIATDSFAARVPLVTSAGPGHAPEFDYLVDGINAVIADRDVLSYSYALEKALLDASLRAEIQSGCDQSFKSFSLDTMVQNYADGLLQWIDHDVN